ncbi:unnamed protein product [Knipowitschia caucasica]|uniref:Ig-like domain-containing protein n=1 Tax=Knipowitschia caucasica TaxID=637954 RepID=A0AAV2L2J5_KNICA
MKSNGVSLGRTGLLRCEAAAVPIPIFEWYKGEKRIIRGQGIDIKSVSTRSVLTVYNMTEDRYGNYTCVATNKMGTANASVTLARKCSPCFSAWSKKLKETILDCVTWFKEYVLMR